MLATPSNDEERVCDTSPFPFCLYLSLLCKIYNLLSAKMWVFHRDNGWRVKERRCSSRKQYKKRTATFFLSLLTSKIACFIPCGRKRTICNCVLQVLVPGNKNVVSCLIRQHFHARAAFGILVFIFYSFRLFSLRFLKTSLGNAENVCFPVLNDRFGNDKIKKKTFSEWTIFNDNAEKWWKRNFQFHHRVSY